MRADACSRCAPRSCARATASKRGAKRRWASRTRCTAISSSSRRAPPGRCMPPISSRAQSSFFERNHPTRTQMTTLLILAVDHSPSMREMLATVLRDSGYQVVEAEDGVKALEVARSHPVDVVLTDQNMPNMDGLSLVKSLRTLPAYRDTPIMMLTTESSDEMKQKGRQAGATGW